MMNIRTIVVAVDSSDASDHAIREGLEQVAAGSAQAMHVVHAIGPDDAPLSEQSTEEDEEHVLRSVARSLTQRVSEIARNERIPFYAELVRTHVRRGTAVEALLRACLDHRADLLIVGTHGRQGLRRILLGSVAETLTRSAPCPVLVSRPKPRRAYQASPAYESSTAPSLTYIERLRPRAHHVDLDETMWRPSDGFERESRGR